MIRQHSSGTACETSPLSTYTAACLLILVIVATVQVTRSCVEYSRIDDCQQNLHEHDWQRMLNGEWLIQFHSPLCASCRKFETTWRCLSKVAKDLNINIAKIDLSTSPSLRGRFVIRSFPTILHVKDGVFHQYNGSMDKPAIIYWLEQKLWHEIEPIPNWRYPDTIQMSIISYFFKLSYALKNISSVLHNEYDLPIWVCYALFTFTTSVILAVGGLILGRIVDLIYQPNKSLQDSNIMRNEKICTDQLENIESKNDGKKSVKFFKIDQLITGMKDNNNLTSKREKYMIKVSRKVRFQSIQSPSMSQHHLTASSIEV